MKHLVTGAELSEEDAQALVKGGFLAEVGGELTIVVEPRDLEKLAASFRAQKVDHMLVSPDMEYIFSPDADKGRGRVMA
jgi:hypothetical protein